MTVITQSENKGKTVTNNKCTFGDYIKRRVLLKLDACLLSTILVFLDLT